MLPYLNIINLLQKNPSIIKDYRSADLIDKLNYCLKNNQNLSEWNLNVLLKYGKKDLELRTILLDEGLFDINWIIWDYCYGDDLQKQCAQSWLQEKLPSHNFQSNKIDNESIEIGINDDSLRHIIEEYYCIDSWVIQSLKKESFEEIKKTYKRLNKLGYWKKDNFDLDIIAKLILEEYDNTKLVPFIKLFLKNIAFGKDYAGLIYDHNLFYHILDNEDNREYEEITAVLEFVYYQIKNIDKWAALISAIIAYYALLEYYYHKTPSKMQKIRMEIASIISGIFTHSENKFEKFKIICGFGIKTEISERIGVNFLISTTYQLIPKDERINALLYLLEILNDNDFPLKFKMEISNNIRPFIKLIPPNQQETLWKQLINELDWGDIEIKLSLLDSLDNAVLLIPPSLMPLFFEKCVSDIENSSKDYQSIVAEIMGYLYPKLDESKQNEVKIFLKSKSKDSHNILAASSNYSLGKIHINKASISESNEEYKDNLENAIKFFEESISRAQYFNKAKFCTPLYKAFYSVTFLPPSNQNDLESNLLDALKNAEQSRTREKLIKLVYSISQAVKRAQQIKDFSESKSELKIIQKLCDDFIELIDETEEFAPNTISIFRKALPIINQQIKELIKNIQNQAENLYQDSIGTPYEPIAKESKSLSECLSPENPEIITETSNQIIECLSSLIYPYLREESRIKVCEILDHGRQETDIVEKLEAIISGYLYCREIIPQIIEKIIGKKDKFYARIAVVQFHYKLLAKYPPQLEDEDITHNKIVAIIDYAANNNVDLILFPELSTSESWIIEICNKYPEMVIVFGSFYKEDYNISPVITNSECYLEQKKNNPSALEDAEICGIGMKTGNNQLFKYSVKFGSFIILICKDFLKFTQLIQNTTDFIIVPSYNTQSIRFHEYAHVMVSNLPSYIIISNCAEFGGSSIFGQIHNDTKISLKMRGYKKDEDDSYKICELDKGVEGIIFADFDTVHKSPQVQSPGDTQHSIKPIKNINIIKLSDII